MSGEAAPEYVDSHCHLDFDAFDEDRDEVVARARAAGVGTMLTIGTRLSRFSEVRAIAERDPGIWCSVGVHPHHVAEEPAATADGLAALAAHPKVVGIGETGLDYHYENSPRGLQRDSLRIHAAAARRAGLPLIVHNRDSDGDMAEILEDETARGPFPGVLHCFSSGRELAERALALGFYLSLSGIVTFRNAGALRGIVADLPSERVLVETDAPFLAPAPNRGRRNEPAFVVHTAAEVARLKGMTIEEISTTSTENFFRLFRKAGRPAGAGAGT